PGAPASAAASAPTSAAAPGTAARAPAAATLDGRIQDAKSDVIKLNRDLLVLEEELLFPANTQVALFVSMDVGKLFELDSVQVKLDDKVVANYLYTPLEVQALHRGGVQRVYLGNLKVGEHELVAFFTGKGPHDRDYKRGATVKFDKSTDPKYIELRIQDSLGKLQPEFDVKVWQ
ncbi:MAG: AraC family transcriptional regulator, partial [Caldimonas sp.]